MKITVALLCLAFVACAPLERADDDARRSEQSEALREQERAREAIVGPSERQ